MPRPKSAQNVLICIKHESLNNPLWKKLEDILTFFGISSSDSSDSSKNSSTAIGLDEEDYWTKVFNNNNNGTKNNTKSEGASNNNNNNNIAVGKSEGIYLLTQKLHKELQLIKL